MVESINNAGSQQALEGNWNDENAMRKFERAADGATRQRKHEILDTKQRPNSVELRAGSKSIDKQPLIAQPQILSPSFNPLPDGTSAGNAPASSPISGKPVSTAKPKFIAVGVVFVMIAIISGVLYLA